MAKKTFPDIPRKEKLDYKKSGVDVDQGDALVDWLVDSQNQSANQGSPWKSRVVEGIGGFASLFDIQFPEIKNPLLVTCTDGVGTKVKLAVQYDRYDEVAQDCVAMCVNDLICTGGRPLLFLDYYATGKLDLQKAKKFVAGLRKACVLGDCALVGGETAEMPGVYQGSDFDCAGFAVGIVDRDQKLGPDKVKPSDVLLAIKSSGFHSNGYSLVRRAFADDMDQWIEKIIQPTSIYVQAFLKILKNCEVHAAAHVTGGGFSNIPRVLPSSLQPVYRPYLLPPLFQELQRRTGLSDDELKKSVNCGVGFVIVLPQAELSAAQIILSEFGFETFQLGSLSPKPKSEPL